MRAMLSAMQRHHHFNLANDNSVEIGPCVKCKDGFSNQI